MFVNIENDSHIAMVYHIDVISHSVGRKMLHQGASHLLLCLSFSYVALITPIFRKRNRERGRSIGTE
jgi:hypothetical protein